MPDKMSGMIRVQIVWYSDLWLWKKLSPKKSADDNKYTKLPSIQIVMASKNSHAWMIMFIIILL